MTAIAEETTESVRGDEKSAEQIDYAKFLLTQTTVPLALIAADCGWRNEQVFATAFERRVGVTPMHYRKWHQ